MDAIGIARLLEEMIKEYEKVETYCILFYSTDHSRDFRLMQEKVNLYRARLNKLLDGSTVVEQIGDRPGKGDIS
jgi:hypothetical protein